MSNLLITILGVILIAAGWFVAVIKGGAGGDPKMLGFGTFILCLGCSMTSLGMKRTLDKKE